jgi:hypothetical protein
MREDLTALIHKAITEEAPLNISYEKSILNEL